MKIGFIEDTKLHGGTQLWVYEAINFFHYKGHEITVITPKNGWLEKQISAKKSKISLFTYDFDTITKEGIEAINTWIIALKRCDVAICTIHPPRSTFHCVVFTAKCIKNGKLNTILIPKTGTIIPTYKREFYLPDETIESYIIAISENTRKFLINHYQIPPERVKLIYQGVDLEKFKSRKNQKEKAKIKYPLPEVCSPILGCIGTIERRKGQDVLIDVINSLMNSFPNLLSIIVGEIPEGDDGSYKKLLERKIKRSKLKDRLIFFPFTSEPEFIFERIDILIFPSLFKEGLPNVLIESLAMGKPVIASNLGGIPEIVINNKTGFLVKPSNVDELVNRIEFLWKNQEIYANLVKAGRKVVERKFCRKRQFEEFLDYFNELVIEKEIILEISDAESYSTNNKKQFRD